MGTTVNVVCYRSKILSNGESPLMIRICKDRKTKYQSLGISIKPEHWDFNKNRPKSNCPNKDLILKIILEKESEFQKQILELKSDNREFTASTLLSSKVKRKTIGIAEFYNKIVEELKLSGKWGTAQVFNDSFNSLNSFTNKQLDVPFSYIDFEFLNKYEVWLRKRNLKETTMGILFRTLRSAYNKAIKEKFVKKDLYPFNDFKVSKFNTKTEKRAISKDIIKQIINLDVSKEKEYVQLSKDIFVFSYLCGGINFTDISNLKSDNIVENRLIYFRQKTHKKINIPLSEAAKNIINKYLSAQRGYIFPILDIRVHKTTIQEHNRKHKVLSKVNNSLRKIAQILDIKTNLTTYVARHSYATVLKRSGVDIAIISETLGHSDLKTTQIYLDSFENEQIDKALENLL